MSLASRLCGLALSLASAAAVAQHVHPQATGTTASCTPAHAAMGHCMLPAAQPQPHAPAQAGGCTPEHAAMGHCTLPAPQATPAPSPAQAAGCTPEHAAMGHCTLPAPQATPAPPRAQAGACTPEHAAMGHCTRAPAATAAPREPLPALTDADRAAAFPALHDGHHAHGIARYGRVDLDRLEAWNGRHGGAQAWEAAASWGGDVHRLWLRSEGEREDGSTHAADVELLAGRGVTPWWDVLAGVRHDLAPGVSQTRAAIGVQGMAPHFVEVSAMAYLGGPSRLSASVELEYELLLTNRLVLQPLLEFSFNTRADPARHAGRGLDHVEAGLRLRYELDRRFAPYIGLVHERSVGDGAEARRAAGQSPRETRVVAGVRAWF